MEQGDLFAMVRSSSRAICALSTILLMSSHGLAQQKRAYQLLPDSVQAVVWIPDGQQLVSRWELTQLSKLAKDPAVKPFFEEQQQTIEKRLLDAGWRLSVKPQDLAEYSTGQIAFAWLERSEALKPFALAMIADVDDDSDANRRMLDELDRHLSVHQSSKKQLRILNSDVTQYTLPKRAGQLLDEDTFFAVVSGHLLVTDDQALMQLLIARVTDSPTQGKTLAEDADFIEAHKRLEPLQSPQLEYFVRPLGIAKVIRAIGGKRSKNSADILAVLKNQGFTAIRCVAGEVVLGDKELDMAHKGLVLADQPLPGSAGVLDFPNKAMQEIPAFVGNRISSLLVTNWNAQTAFWKVRGLVDEITGTEGVFDEVINGIHQDPSGPHIDIRNEVLPLFTNDIISISDTRDGIVDVDSRRNLIGLRVKDAAAMAAVLDRVMKNEPDAELVEFEGHVVWKVVHNQDNGDHDLSAEFGEFGSPDDFDEEAKQPWLSNWAITVYDDYLLFASHVELIEEAIQQAASGGATHLSKEADYGRIRTALSEHFGSESTSGWQIVRNNLAYRVQYELFRQGKLQESQSMLASVLERLLHKNSELDSNVEKVNGHILPDFEKIAPFLQPSGIKIRTTDYGWEFGGLLLSSQPTSDLSASYEVGTARVSNSESESKR